MRRNETGKKNLGKITKMSIINFDDDKLSKQLLSKRITGNASGSAPDSKRRPAPPIHSEGGGRRGGGGCLVPGLTGKWMDLTLSAIKITS